MARTSAAAVSAILLRDYDVVTAPSLVPFIETATLIVDRVVECAAEDDKVHTTAELERIEAWLAAHYYSQTDKNYTSRSTEGASGAFAGQTGMHLQSTLYGQTAMNIDFSGCLAELQAAATLTPTPVNIVKATSFAWLGKPRSSQIDYDQRD